MRRGLITLATLLLSILSIPSEAQTNLVLNPGFQNNLASWTPILSSPFWSPVDAAGSSSSGSAVLHNNAAAPQQAADLRQCIFGIVPGHTYSWGGKVRIPNQTQTGYAYMYLVWVSSITSLADCSGHVRVDAGASVFSMQVPANTWLPLNGQNVVAPAGAVGAQISFNIQKQEAGGEFRYHADDAFLRDLGGPPASLSISGPENGRAMQNLTYEAIASGCVANPTGWTWGATGGATIVGGTTRTVSVSWPAAGNYSLTHTNSGCPGTSGTKQVNITAAPAEIILTNSTAGMVQDVGVGGAIDRYTLRNVGGTRSSITLAQTGNFFNQSPTSFTLEPGATQVITLTGIARPAGFNEGSSRPSGDGVPANLSIPVRLLVAAAPAGPVSIRPTVQRVDVVESAGAPVSGTAPFSNTGAATSAIVVSSVPWIRPQSGVINVPAGGTLNVSFTIDRSARPDGLSPAGSASGELSLVFRSAAQAAQLSSVRPFQTGTSGVTKVTIVDTVRPDVSSGGLPPLASGEVALFIPGVGHVTGSVGTFLTDITIVNRQASDTLSDVRLYYTSITGAQTQTTSLPSLVAGQPLFLGDLVKAVFQKDAEVGTLQIRATDVNKVAVNANIFNSSNPNGTYGTVVPVFRSDRAVGPGSSLTLTGLRRDAQSHTNMYFQETQGGAVSVQIEFRGRAGEFLGSREENLGPFGLIQRSDFVPTGAVTAVLTSTNSSTGRFVAFATPVDRASGDTWSVGDWRQVYGYSAVEPLLIPIAGVVRGANNTHFRTDVAITNTSSALALGFLQYYSRTGEALERRVPLEPRETRVFDDVISSLFEVNTDSVGSLTFVPSTGAFAVTSRTYTTVAGAAATFGTGVPTLSLAASLKPGDVRRIGGIEDSSLESIAAARPATFRTNFALVETAGGSVTIRVTALYSYTMGASVGAVFGSASKDYTLSPRQFLLLTNIARELIGEERERFGDLHNLQIDFAVTGGTGAVSLFTSSVDNGTGDSILRVE